MSDENFLDVSESLASTSGHGRGSQSDSASDLSTALLEEILEVEKAIDLFFNNKFLEAKALTAAKAPTHMYHALGYSTLLFVEALMTFENEDISTAMGSIRSSLNVCNKYRKRKSVASSFGQFLGLTQTSDPSDVERHADLVCAELNLYRATLTFIQDENLVSFIRGALKIRMCYQMYQSCQKLAAKLEPTPNNLHFIGGALVGCGSFNVGLSLLPPRVLSMLEWIGFSANKAVGLKQLLQGYRIPNLRNSLIALYLMGYHFFLTTHLGMHDGDMELGSEILSGMYEKYPNGIFCYLFTGRYEQIKGNFDEAITYYTKAAAVQSQWRQFFHICYWELMWCHAYKMEWEKASGFAELLRRESNWSKCVYTYLCAVFLYQSDPVDNHHHILNLMATVPSLLQRLAGKSIPIEKFVMRKSRKFYDQQGNLFLPAQEMMYCWNGLVMLKENSELRAKHLQLLNKEFAKFERRTSVTSTVSDTRHSEYYDDYCLIQLLKGTLLRFNKEEIKAEVCLRDIGNRFEKLKRDHYLAPAAMSDLAMMMIDQERYEEANSLLKYTRKTYSHYSLESRIHFRIHAAQTRLDQIMAEMAGTS